MAAWRKPSAAAWRSSIIEWQAKNQQHRNGGWKCGSIISSVGSAAWRRAQPGVINSNGGVRRVTAKRIDNSGMAWRRRQWHGGEAWRHLSEMARKNNSSGANDKQKQQRRQRISVKTKSAAAGSRQSENENQQQRNRKWRQSKTGQRGGEKRISQHQQRKIIWLNSGNISMAKIA